MKHVLLRDSRLFSSPWRGLPVPIWTVFGFLPQQTDKPFPFRQTPSHRKGEHSTHFLPSGVQADAVNPYKPKLNESLHVPGIQALWSLTEITGRMSLLALRMFSLMLNRSLLVFFYSHTASVSDTRVWVRATLGWNSSERRDVHYHSKVLLDKIL